MFNYYYNGEKKVSRCENELADPKLGAAFNSFRPSIVFTAYGRMHSASTMQI